MAPRRVHIAILDTDVPMPTVYAARGLYSSQFRVLLQAAARRLNASGIFSDSPVEVITTAYDVVGGALPHLALLRTQPQRSSNSQDNTFGPLGHIDALLITGSSASAYQLDQHPWIASLQSFLQTVYAEYPAVKMFGSCFGHQIIAQALLSHHSPRLKHQVVNHNPVYGFASVAACPEGYEVGIHPVILNPEFVRYFPALSCLPQGDLRIQLIHGDRVMMLGPEGISDVKPDAFPAPWLNLGSTRKSPIQGLYNPGRVLTYQGHFEFDVWVNRETCFEFARRAGWSEADLSSYLTNIRPLPALGDDDDDDSKIAAEVVVMFLAAGHEEATVPADKSEEAVDGMQPNAVIRNGLITPPLTDRDRVEPYIE